MIVNLKEILKDAPVVEGKKFSRGSTVNLDGFCSPYLFAERPSCKCYKKFWTENDLGKECRACESIVMQNKGMGKSVLDNDLVLLNPSIYSMVSRSGSFFKNNRRISEDGSSMEEENSFFSFVELSEKACIQEKIDYLLIHVNKMKTKNKEGLIKLIEIQREKDPESLFTNVIPIISLKFRLDDTGSIGELNKYYGALLQTVDTLNISSVETAETIDLIILGIHKQLEKINIYLSDLKLLRNEFNPIVSMSSRLPVLPQNSDEDFRGITLSYNSFLRIYKYQILRVLKSEYNFSIKEALKEYSKLNWESEMLHRIVDILKEDALLLINRVPSLTPRSLVAMKLNGICNSFTIQVSKIVFAQLGMDADGDTLAVFPLFTKEAKDKARLNLSVEACTRSIFDYNYRNLDKNITKMYSNEYGIYLLEKDFLEKRNKKE